MFLRSLVVGPIGANCFIIGDEDAGMGIIIDPGGEADRIVKAVEKSGLDIKFIIATHGHFDHTAGVTELKKTMDVDFLIHEDDLFFVRDSKSSAERWGIPIDQVPDPDGYVEDGQELEVGDIKIKVIHTPGHSPGGICLHLPEEKVLFSGDTIFQRSIGRTDFREGSMSKLSKSIKTRLYTLPDDTVVHTGHGPKTTIGEEKAGNPFVRP